MRHNAHSSIILILIVINLKIVIKKFLSPPDLSKTKAFYNYKLTKVVIVSKYEHFILRTLQIVVPDLEYFDNGQKFTAMSFISSFFRNYHFQKIGYQVLLRLGQNLRI